MSLADKLREELDEIQKKKKVAIIEIQGYLKILTELLNVAVFDSYPGLFDEIKDFWRKLSDSVGSPYQKDSLLGLLRREQELQDNILLEEKYSGEEGKRDEV